MNCRKSILIIGALMTYVLTVSAQILNINQVEALMVDSHISDIYQSDAVSETKSGLDISDKIIGSQTEVPAFNPEINDDFDIVQVHWSVYPNPSTHSFILWIKNLDSLQSVEHLSYRLYDVKGNLLLSDRIEGEKTDIDTEFLLPAMYYLSVVEEKSIKSFKIIKY